MKKEYILYGVIAIIVMWIAVLLFDKFNNSNGDYFKNNLECQKYLEKVKDRLPDYENHTIFYSSRENTCLGMAYTDMWGYSSAWEIEDIFSSLENHRYSYYSWYKDEKREWASIHSYFTNKQCSDLDEWLDNCNISNYWELIKARDEEIEWLKWN